MRRYLTALLMAFLAVTLVVTAVGCRRGAKPEEVEKVVTFARPEELLYLDPQNHFNIVNRILENLIYDYLMDLTPDGQLVPRLAERWEISEDQHSITLHLRRGVKFHNGEPFTAASVKFTLERMRDNPGLRGAGIMAAELKEVEIVDDCTAIVHLKRPFGPIFSEFSYYPMLPPQAYAELGDKLWEHPVGTGPYKFVEWVKDVRYVVEANRDYWGKAPTVDRIIYRPIKEPATLVAGLLTKDLDIIDTVPPEQVPVLEQTKGIVVLREPAWDQFYFGLNMRNPVLQDKRVRYAIDYALDRDLLVEFMGGGRPAWITSPPGVLGYHPEFRSEHNPDLARRLLAETGFTPEQLTFDFIVPEGWYPRMREVAELLQRMLAEVGITLKMRMLEGGPFTEARAAGAYDIYITGAAFRGDPHAFLDARVRRDIMGSGYVNEKLNALIAEAGASLDLNWRHERYREVYRIMFEEKAPHITIYQMEAIYAHWDWISGFPFPPHKTADLRYVETTRPR